MYLKNLNHKMTLRLDDDLKAFLDEMSDIYHLTPSDFIRQLLATSMRTFELQKEAERQLVDGVVKKSREGLENGCDRKTDINNIIQQ